MRFQIITLVDITETGARRGAAAPLEYQQESNFQTIIQTAGLRTNISYTHAPTAQMAAVGKLGFADKYKGKHMLWTFTFDVEQDSAVSLIMLEQDFDLVPILTKLSETAKFDRSILRTLTEERNIIFSVLDAE